jgi:hypothetical protein
MMITPRRPGHGCGNVNVIVLDSALARSAIGAMNPGQVP